MNEALATHIRLMESRTLPVRTVASTRLVVPANGVRWNQEVRSERREFIRKNLGKMTIGEMARALDVGRKSVRDYTKQVRQRRYQPRDKCS